MCQRHKKLFASSWLFIFDSFYVHNRNETLNFNSFFETFRFDFAERSVDFSVDCAGNVECRGFCFVDGCNAAREESLGRRWTWHKERWQFSAGILRFAGDRGSISTLDTKPEVWTKLTRFITINKMLRFTFKNFAYSGCFQYIRYFR